MAKNDPANIVAGAGLLTGIFTKLNTAVYELGGSAEDLHRLTKPEGDAIIRAMAEQLVKPLVFTVDYDSADWFAELGDYFQHKIPGHFCPDDPLQEEFVKLHPVRYGRQDVRFAFVELEGGTPRQALAEMERRALRRPNSAEAWEFFRNADLMSHPDRWLCGELEEGRIAGFTSDGELIFPYWFELDRADDDLTRSTTYLAVVK